MLTFGIILAAFGVALFLETTINTDFSDLPSFDFLFILSIATIVLGIIIAFKGVH